MRPGSRLTRLRRLALAAAESMQTGLPPVPQVESRAGSGVWVANDSGVMDASQVSVGVWVGSIVMDGSAVALAVAVSVGVSVAAAEAVSITRAVSVAVSVRVGLLVSVGVADGEHITVGVAVAVGVWVGVADGGQVIVGVADEVGVSVGVAVDVIVALEVADEVGVTVEVVFARGVKEGSKVKVGAFVTQGWRVGVGMACCALALRGKSSADRMMNTKVRFLITVGGGGL